MSTQNVTTKIKNPMSIALTLALLLSFIVPAMAQEDNAPSQTNAPAAPSQEQGPTDAVEMEAFLDELMAKDMEEYHIPGAAVSVVKNGVLFFAKGYGYADLENKIPVDPEQTLFPTGSVGKLFTWMAVMQIAEQGKLDLDADVNTYLDFRIPDTYPQPITLKHLMTHTPGFEDLSFENFAWDADGLMPVDEWLATHIPARVRPPGEVAAYSNYGVELAGYIVARVSGQPYEQYIQEHIFDPLGMAHSTIQIPVPPDLRTHVSLGYWNVEGVSQAVPSVPDDFMVQPATAPEGQHLSSVTDMARFMITHLQYGFYGDASTGTRILEETTARQMQGTLYTPDPRILGAAYGFFDFSDNGQRTLGHTGQALGFTTMLLLLPDQDLGVYVVYNHNESGGLTTQHFGFQRAFFDHYYPAPEVEPIRPPADFNERASQFVGSYKSTWSAYTTFEKFGNFLSSPPIEISDPADGTLLLTIKGFEVRLVEVEPLYFRQVDGPFGVVFREDDRGRITHIFTDVAPQETYEKLNWYETTGFNWALFLGCVLVFLSMIPVALVRAIRNRLPSGDRKSASRGAHLANWTIVGISVLNLLFVVGVTKMFFSLGFPFFGVTLFDTIVLGLGVLSALLTVGALVYGVLAWKDHYWSVAYRVYYTLVTVAAVAFVWFLNFWNLLGWRY
ncbi:MAG TPA: serine hydrolase domain-containing protein [Anaerolineales bacterium]|nr:serine hydrolase domain-containing protein [Anaerolineales bacterium]